MTERQLQIVQHGQPSAGHPGAFVGPDPIQLTSTSLTRVVQIGDRPAPTVLPVRLRRRRSAGCGLRRTVGGPVIAVLRRCRRLWLVAPRLIQGGLVGPPRRPYVRSNSASMTSSPDDEVEEASADGAGPPPRPPVAELAARAFSACAACCSSPVSERARSSGASSLTA